MWTGAGPSAGLMWTQSPGEMVWLVGQSLRGRTALPGEGCRVDTGSLRSCPVPTCTGGIEPPTADDLNPGMTRAAQVLSQPSPSAFQGPQRHTDQQLSGKLSVPGSMPQSTVWVPAKQTCSQRGVQHGAWDHGTPHPAAAGRRLGSSKNGGVP